MAEVSKCLTNIKFKSVQTVIKVWCTFKDLAVAVNTKWRKTEYGVLMLKRERRKWWDEIQNNRKKTTSEFENSELQSKNFADALHA